MIVRSFFASCILLLSLTSTPDAAEADTTRQQPLTLGDWLYPEAEIVLANGIVAGYNIFIARHDWARVSGSSIRHNMTSAWEWDHDQFHINQFGHPYQGALYYSAARHFGHGFWASTGYTAFGSLQWEYLMETEAPSYNDFITTTFGGAMLGEITYRIASSVLDDNASGFERLGRELTAAAINPVHGINRVLNGNAWAGPGKSRSPKPREESIVRLSTGTTLAFGSHAEGEEHNPLQRVPKANTEALVVYGDPFSARAPYDHFILNAGVNILRDPVATITSRAQIYGRELFESENGEGIWMVGQNFDYIHNGIYKLGVSGFGLGYSHRFLWGEGWYHTAHTQLAGIAVGGVSTEFFKEQSRDYNLGPGAFGTARVVLGKGDSWHGALIMDRYWLRTRSGAKGDELIGVNIAEAGKSLYKGFGALVSYSVYDRSARYRDFGTKREISHATKGLITYTFD